MMLPDFRKYILPPVTQICAEACEILAEKAQNKEQTETGMFFASKNYLKMQRHFPKVAAGNSSKLHKLPKAC